MRMLTIMIIALLTLILLLMLLCIARRESLQPGRVDTYQLKACESAEATISSNLPVRATQRTIASSSDAYLSGTLCALGDGLELPSELHVIVQYSAQTGEIVPPIVCAVNASGRFRTPIPPMAAAVHFDLKEPFVELIDPREIAVSSSRSQEVILTLKVGGLLRITVFDAHDNPSAGESIIIESMSGTWLMNGPTNEMGEWTSGLLDPGYYRASCWIDNRVERIVARVDALKLESAEIRKPDGCSAVVRGRLDYHSYELGDIGFSLTMLDQSWRDNAEQEWSIAKDGRFAMTTNRCGPGELTIVTPADTFLRLPITVFPGVQELETISVPSGGIRGVLRFPASPVVRSAKVILKQMNLVELRTLRIGRASTVADAYGRFSFDWLPIGMYALWAEVDVEDGTKWISGVHYISISARDSTRDVDVHVEAGGEVRGVVHLQGRGPVAWTRVYYRDAATRQGPWRHLARTLDDGTFAVRGIAPGRYDLGVEERLYTSAGRVTIDVLPGDVVSTNLTVIEGPKLLVMWRFGEELRFFMARLLPDDPSNDHADRDASVFAKHHRFGPLPLGDYSLEVVDVEGTTWRKRLHLEDASSDVVVVL